MNVHARHAEQSIGPQAAGLGIDRPPTVAGRAMLMTAAAAVAPLILVLALLGGLGSFATVREMARPWVGGLAWIVPVGMDVGIVALLAWDLLMEYAGLPWPVLRWVAWAYIAGTVAVNVIAAGGDLAASVMHAAMPVLFVTIVEGVRQLIRRWAGLAAGTRIEKIPAPRWILAPISTALLWRKMVLWHITSYRRGLELEHQHLLAVSALQQKYGRLAWRWQAPLAERMALSLLPAGDRQSISIHGMGADLEACDLAVEARRRPEPGWLDDELLAAARQVLTGAQGQGVRLSRTQFGRRLRELGFSIANDRLAELRDAALDRSAGQDRT